MSVYVMPRIKLGGHKATTRYSYKMEEQHIIIDKSDTHIQHAYICTQEPRTFHTQKQKITLGNSAVYGDMLFIDDEIQSSTSDEKIYHSTMARIPLYGFPDQGRPLKILVCGSAEGCLLRELLKVSQGANAMITQVDWDKELVDYFRGPGHHWNDGAYEKAQRLQLVYENVFTWIKGVDVAEKWDIMYMDLIDPDESTHELYNEFLQDCSAHLADNGRLIINNGEFTPSMKGLLPIIHEIFPEYNLCIVPCYIPSYMGIWNFVYIQKDRMNMSYIEKMSALPTQWSNWRPF